MAVHDKNIADVHAHFYRVSRLAKIKLHNQISKTFCPLPFLGFYGSAKGEIVPCCEAQETVMSNFGESFLETWNNSHYKKLRKAFLNGERPASCWKCWENEDNGQYSNRERARDDLDANFFGHSEFWTSDDGEVTDAPAFLELKPSNICNLKCRMCGPESSFRIGEDQEIIDEFRPGWVWPERPSRASELFNQIMSGGDDVASRIRVLQYSGGEPLVSEEQYRLTHHLAEKYGHQIELRYATNLTQLKFEKYQALEIWRKFKFVNVKISADGVGDVYDYIRVGASFDRLRENIEAVQELNLPNIRLMIGFTTQAYNAFQLPETYDVFHKLISDLSISSHLLFTPNIMSLDVYPPKLRERVIRKLQSSNWDFQSKIHYLKENEYSPLLEDRWNRLLSFTDAMEKKYGITNGFHYLLEKYLDGY